MTKNMTAGNPAKLLLFFTLPVIMGNILQQLYSVTDTLIVGQTIGVDALAAVGATGVIVSLPLCFIEGLTTGFAVVVGQRFGAQDEEGVRRSAATSLLLCLLLTMLLTSVTVAVSRPVLRLMNTPPNIFEEANRYLTAIFIGTGATVFYNMLSNVIRALGDSRTPLIFLGVAAAANVGLDLLFILVFHMGVAGAAWATVLAQLLSAVLCLLFVRRRFPILRLSRRDFCITWQDAFRQLRIGFPMGFQMSVMCIGLLIVQAVLNGFGSDAVAAFTAASKVDQLAVQVGGSFGIAISAYVAQNYGAGNFRRIRRGVNCCLFQAAVGSVILGALILTCGQWIAQLFIKGDHPEILAMTRMFFYIVVPFYVLVNVLIIYRSTLQSMGRTLFPLLACVVELIMRAFAALVFGRLWGYAGVCFATPLAWTGAAILLFIGYRLVMRRLPSGDAGEDEKLPAVEICKEVGAENTGQTADEVSVL